MCAADAGIRSGRRFAPSLSFARILSTRRLVGKLCCGKFPRRRALRPRACNRNRIPTYALTHTESSDDEALVNFEQLIGAVPFDVVLFAFWYCAERYLPLVRNLSPQTIVVVDSVDIQFLRESRRVFSDFGRNGQPQTLDSEYARQTMRELNTYAAAMRF